jgi:type II secretory pathway component PulC
MNDDIKVIWQKGDGEIPEKAKHIVETAQGELLLKALELPSEVVDAIRYNADKNAQTINHYISAIVMERLRSAS